MSKSYKCEKEDREYEEGRADGMDEFKKSVHDTVNLKLIDKKFHEWCLQCSDKFKPQKKLTYKEQTRYFHASIPYRSTIFDFGDDDGKWRNIKLCNNGFTYNKVPGNPKTISRHSSDNWNLLNICLPHLKHVHQYFKEHCGQNCRICVFYHFKKNRLDIKCKGKDVNIMLTFEPGYPFEETNDMFQ